MASHPRLPFPNHLPLPLPRSSSSLVLSPPSSFDFPALKLRPLAIQQHSSSSRRHFIHTSTRAVDDDSFDMPSPEEWTYLDDYENFPPPAAAESYVMSSSDGEDSDRDAFLTPVNDLELPAVSSSSASSNHKDSITVAAHRFATLSSERKKHRIKRGMIITVGLIIVLLVLLLYVDWCAWRIVRLPLSPFYLTRPFLLSAILVSFAGYVCVPIFRGFRAINVIKRQGPIRHRLRKRTPTLGGLFFVPIGIIVALLLVGSSSAEVSGAAGMTVAFAAVGLLNDILSLTKNHRRGLPALAELILEIAVGTWFSFWLDITSISSPYGMKMLVPLPPGLMYLGRYYHLLTSFSFVSVGHGIKLADALDGLAGGTAALAFTGMSIAVLPICSDLAIFGASMAGSCVGFLLHNRYKASVFMGNTGSLALGGALAAMAACSGMFFPLFISSGILVLEASSVIIQILHLNVTKGLQEAGWRFLRMPPFHYHLQLRGFREPNIVLGAYLISSVLALLGGYVGLISA
ncbi:hypothetical protein HN51_030088 [Arachis hypogaea]|uniref:Phospho-N-acetylmuramoyl-pentapeptide-transferase n=1 Tax=Arachis hypogaea TaxID=3818 RepID=A0A445BCF8_ARAHY|nr:phospho-N-acetylmuramoyl-pentapeptide-transferase homolog [Arachis hypogaea]QHO14526.1 uncharacterized protein DS421_10g287120 [Arachis hypogaea]RYR36365.1 hypothetical protein Ahy_A10g051339 [Arachis hypogaea]